MSLNFKIIVLSIIVFLIGCNHLLYPAVRDSYVVPESIIPPPQDLQIPLDKNDKNSFVHAWYFPTKETTRKGLVVHFHGNGENLTTHFLFLYWIIHHGYDYLIFDYRGYGRSSDEQATQQKTVEDGQAVFKYVKENFKGVPVIAFGQSLGSNVLVRSLQEMNKKSEPLPQLVVLDSAFLSYQQAASSVLSQRWFLYPLKPFAYVIISDEWSAAQLTSSTPSIPAVFFHGTKDTIVDYKLGQKNYETWPGPKVFFTQESGGHTSAFAEERFLKSRNLLLNCIDYSLNKKENFTDCGK